MVYFKLNFCVCIEAVELNLKFAMFNIILYKVQDKFHEQKNYTECKTSKGSYKVISRICIMTQIGTNRNVLFF